MRQLAAGTDDQKDPPTVPDLKPWVGADTVPVFYQVTW